MNKRTLSITIIALFIFSFIVSYDAARADSSNNKNTLQPGSTFRDCPQCPRMTVIPAGQFMMGSSDNEISRDIQNVPENFRKGIPFLVPGQLDYMKQEQPQHLVKIANAFALGTYPVTRGEFAAFVEETGYVSSKACTLSKPKYLKTPTAYWQRLSFTQGDHDPVVCVTLQDVQKYIDWLNSKVASTNQANAHGTYQLPSEAEWEYAARAGTHTAYWWGDAVGQNNANCKKCGSEWDNKQPSPVGNFYPNAFGLYDVSGNVAEWTGDCWNDYYASAPSNGRTWNIGDCGDHVTRGGSWASDYWVLRSASRTRWSANESLDQIGFRVAKKLE